MSAASCSVATGSIRKIDKHLILAKSLRTFNAPAYPTAIERAAGKVRRPFLAVDNLKTATDGLERPSYEQGRKVPELLPN
ncbi:hypothetical protein K227x_54960 [Rubripirellula lacrimiformis]|uniref:Uncharacterized protein n=1 Tax=Rubripirellula lacrimiformis TaxID=1930273 RepID=A0A517NIW0_9BACT|nr:hypothetical protein K227x_54960 [Rubripirellula lacrimiformis]